MERLADADDLPCRFDTTFGMQFEFEFEAYAILTLNGKTFAGLVGSRFQARGRRERGDDPDTLPPVKPASQKCQNNIFKMEWCTAVIDEIHEFRGDKSRYFLGALALANCVKLIVGASATLIVSQPRVSFM